MACIQYQIHERAFADAIPLSGPSFEINGRDAPHARYQFDPHGRKMRVKVYTKATSGFEKAHGQWNLLEYYVFEDRAVHLLNGEVVMALDKAMKGDGSKLVKGKLQFQSEGAELYFKNLKLRPLFILPEFLDQHFER